jgi:predicted DNA-binding protein with PD1-like motif
MTQRFAELPRPRTLVHPGPVGRVRIEHAAAERGRHFRLVLPTGRSLHDGLVQALQAEGVRCASMTLIGGALENLHFCLAEADDSGRTVARYSRPLQAATALFIFGNATLGLSAAGAPMVHCHGVFRLPDGSVRGGHVLTDRTLAGAAPVTVLATALDGIELRIGFDEETGMPLMRPRVGPSGEALHG